MTYIEDDVRVNPDNGDTNFLSHCKFYEFAAQFVRKKYVADVGCGTGYGCEILKEGGASFVSGTDISSKAIAYAKESYSYVASFSIQDITNLKRYLDDCFDVSVCSEVLEHIRGDGREKKAISELKRITKENGIIVIGTPNEELHKGHGFSFVELNDLLKDNFYKFCIFETAFFSSEFLKRIDRKELGIIVTEHIDYTATVLHDFWKDGMVPIIKKGIEPGIYKIGGHKVDTTLLHNPYSWVVVAINDKMENI